MSVSIRPRKGRRVRWQEYVEVKGENRYEKVEREGVVLTRVEYLSRPHMSAPRSYLKIKEDSGRVHRVDFFQLVGYVEEAKA